MQLKLLATFPNSYLVTSLSDVTIVYAPPPLLYQ